MAPFFRLCLELKRYNRDWTVQITRDIIHGSEEEAGKYVFDASEVVTAHYNLKLENEALIGSYYENTSNSHMSKNHKKVQL